MGQNLKNQAVDPGGDRAAFYEIILGSIWFDVKNRRAVDDIQTLHLQHVSFFETSCTVENAIRLGRCGQRQAKMPTKGTSALPCG